MYNDDFYLSIFENEELDEKWSNDYNYMSWREIYVNGYYDENEEEEEDEETKFYKWAATLVPWRELAEIEGYERGKQFRRGDEFELLADDPVFLAYIWEHEEQNEELPPETDWEALMSDPKYQAYLEEQEADASLIEN